MSNNKISNKNNFNNNITTVNIINNNNDINNNKKKLNDYHLLWFNRSNRDNLPYLQKISSKGIKIQSININLGEDLEDNNCNKNNNINFEPNPLKDYNASEINKEKETKSEYNHYRDIDDLWSSKSLSSYSCKSGYTITRKLRSLSRERDKIKLLNQCKKNKNDIKMIGDKLLNIVNNFHNNNVINLKKSRRKDEIRKINKKNKRNKILKDKLEFETYSVNILSEKKHKNEKLFMKDSENENTIKYSRNKNKNREKFSQNSDINSKSSFETVDEFNIKGIQKKNFASRVYTSLKDAKKFNQTSFCEYYCLLIGLRQPIINLFVMNKCTYLGEDYVPFTIKIIRFIFMISLNLFMNVLHLNHNYFYDKFEYFDKKYDLRNKSLEKEISSNEIFSYAFKNSILMAFISFVFCYHFTKI